MQRYLTLSSTGCDPRVDVSEAEFEQIKLAVKGLISALRIEEKYNLLRENYAEFEKEMLDLTLSQCLFGDHDWLSDMRDLDAANRRLVNFLTTARLYEDQVQRELGKSYVNGASLARDFEAMMEDEAGSSFSFQLMRELRNHAQHRELPLQRIGYVTFGYPEYSSVGGRLSSRQKRHIRTADIAPRNLSDDKRTTKAFRQRLADMKLDEYVDIRPFIREYMQALTRIHINLRARLEEDIEPWARLIIDCIDRVAQASGAAAEAAIMVAIDEQGVEMDKLLLSREHIERREMLTRRNCALYHLDKFVVSNEIKVDD